MYLLILNIMDSLDNNIILYYSFSIFRFFITYFNNLKVINKILNIKKRA